MQCLCVHLCPHLSFPQILVDLNLVWFHVAVPLVSYQTS